VGGCRQGGAATTADRSAAVSETYQYFVFSRVQPKEALEELWEAEW